MDLKARAEELLGRRLESVRVVTDTTQFMDLNMGDVLELEDRLFLLRGITYEGRFGLDEEPKHWVRTGYDLRTGEPKIIKLVFYEQFDLPIGKLKVRCFRSPAKEARVLELVRGHPNFMQGRAYRDAAGNQVRVVDRVRGGPFERGLVKLGRDVAEYHQKHLRAQLLRLMPAVEAIGMLHRQGQRHGDVRRDHLFEQRGDSTLVWIDYDYNFDLAESPFGLDLFGLGNVICFVAGRGIPTLHDLARERPQDLDRLDSGDVSPVIPNRVFNLKKLYPYLPGSLNRVLMHFSASSPVFYERVEELTEDLAAAIEDLPGPPEEERP